MRVIGGMYIPVYVCIVGKFIHPPPPTRNEQVLAHPKPTHPPTPLPPPNPTVVLADRLGLPTLSVVNSVGSLIARTTKLGVYLNAGRESSVASTKAFTTQVTGRERGGLPMLLVCMCILHI